MGVRTCVLVVGVFPRYIINLFITGELTCMNRDCNEFNHLVFRI
nr:MAG TPA: hypothetical protein [Caudoviricetes sp.]